MCPSPPGKPDSSRDPLVASGPFPRLIPSLRHYHSDFLAFIPQKIILLYRAEDAVMAQEERIRLASLGQGLIAIGVKCPEPIKQATDWCLKRFKRIDRCAG